MSNSSPERMQTLYEWQEKDEFSLLLAVQAISQESVENYNPRINLFDRIEKFLNKRFGYEVILSQIKELKKRFYRTRGFIESNFEVNKNKIFLISKDIWGRKENNGELGANRRNENMEAEDNLTDAERGYRNEMIETKDMEKGAQSVSGNETMEVEDNKEKDGQRDVGDELMEIKDKKNAERSVSENEIMEVEAKDKDEQRDRVDEMIELTDKENITLRMEDDDILDSSSTANYVSTSTMHNGKRMKVLNQLNVDNDRNCTGNTNPNGVHIDSASQLSIYLHNPTYSTTCSTCTLPSNSFKQPVNMVYNMSQATDISSKRSNRSIAQHNRRQRERSSDIATSSNFQTLNVMHAESRMQVFNHQQTTHLQQPSIEAIANTTIPCPFTHLNDTSIIMGEHHISTSNSTNNDNNIIHMASLPSNRSVAQSLRRQRERMSKSQMSFNIENQNCVTNSASSGFTTTITSTTKGLQPTGEVTNKDNGKHTVNQKSINLTIDNKFSSHTTVSTVSNRSIAQTMRRQRERRAKNFKSLNAQGENQERDGQAFGRMKRSFAIKHNHASSSSVVDTENLLASFPTVGELIDEDNVIQRVITTSNNTSHTSFGSGNEMMKVEDEANNAQRGVENEMMEMKDKEKDAQRDEMMEMENMEKDTQSGVENEMMEMKDKEKDAQRYEMMEMEDMEKDTQWGVENEIMEMKDKEKDAQRDVEKEMMETNDKKIDKQRVVGNEKMGNKEKGKQRGVENKMMEMKDKEKDAQRDEMMEMEDMEKDTQRDVKKEMMETNDKKNYKQRVVGNEKMGNKEKGKQSVKAVQIGGKCSEATKSNSIISSSMKILRHAIKFKHKQKQLNIGGIDAKPKVKCLGATQSNSFVFPSSKILKHAIKFKHKQKQLNIGGINAKSKGKIQPAYKVLKNRSSMQKDSEDKRLCFRCGKAGHMKRDCTLEKKVMEPLTEEQSTKETLKGAGTKIEKLNKGKEAFSASVLSSMKNRDDELACNGSNKCGKSISSVTNKRTLQTVLLKKRKQQQNLKSQPVSKKQNTGVKCYECGNRGHIASSCVQRKADSQVCIWIS